MTSEPTCAACDQLVRALCLHHMIRTHPALYACKWQTERVKGAAPVVERRAQQWPPEDPGQVKEPA